MSKANKPGYFEKPDGEDILGKLLYVLKPTVVTAVGVGTADVMLYSHPKGYLKTLGRYAYIGFPIIGASTAFVCTTNLAASIRKKDDYLNWFLGGFAAGSIFGIWKRSPMLGFNMGMALGIFALIKKDCVNKGWELIPSNVKVSNGGVWMDKYDWTLTAPRTTNYSWQQNHTK